MKQTEEQLPTEEFQYLPNSEKSKYMERYLESLLLKNKDRGLTLSEIIKISRFSKPTLIKHLGLLFSKRKIYREKKGNSYIYYPNGRISHPSDEGEILFDNKKYKFSVVSYDGDSKSIYIQEKIIDENGFDEVVGGIMFPLGKEEMVKLLKQLKKIYDNQLNSKIED